MVYFSSLTAREQLNKSEQEKDNQRKAFEAEIAELQARFEEEIQVRGYLLLPMLTWIWLVGGSDNGIVYLWSHWVCVAF